MNSQKTRRSRVQGGWADMVKQTPHKPSASYCSQFAFQQPLQSEMSGIEPPNFSWVIDGVLAGCAFPSRQPHFQFLHKEGVRHIITLTERKINMSTTIPGMKNLHIPVVEFQPPSIEQIKRFVDYVDDSRSRKEAVVVHCHWGLGRTGTMLAAYLVKDQNTHPRSAIDKIRSLRPYSIETHEQEGAVFEYAKYLGEKIHPKQETNTQTEHKPGRK